MPNFSIGTQLENELKDFTTGKVKLAVPHNTDQLRFLKKNPSGYYYNQMETITEIDLAYSSKFNNGEKDKLGHQKIYLNVSKFRSDVASKQIDIDVKDFRFLPDDYADPWTAFFMQKDFNEWAKDSYFGEIVNECVDNLPKYGTVVLKKVGKKVEVVALQNLRNQQTARSLQEATYVIEEHPEMYLWEMELMPDWDTTGLVLKWNESTTVYERYGRVPLDWLKRVNKQPVVAGDEKQSVDSVVILIKTKNRDKDSRDGVHVLFAEQLTERPYREAHWSRQHGRWLGVGVMEDLSENQKASNIIANLERRSLHWSSKRAFQSASTDMVQKNLAKDVEDGAVLEVGAQGQITQIDLGNKSIGEFNNFLNMFDKNSDQKSFTYEVATGESMSSGTPYRLGVLLSEAVNSYFALKREKLGLFLKAAIMDFEIPEFIKDMGNEARVVSMFSDEPGFEALKDAAMRYVRSEAARITILSGQVVDPSTIEQMVDPAQEIRSLFVTLPPKAYKEVKYKFQLSVTGEEIDLKSKLQTLQTLYQSLMASGDAKRAEKVLERISALTGENLAIFGAPGNPAPTPMNPGQTTAPPANANNAGAPA